ncbi:MAG: diacylglycerol kinase family lipid kinase [Firmicutes bacterium]|nr:diacylglycerol kinase family lipid kinase [Bacillota bacterium]
MRYFFIVNPTAGRGRAAAVWRQLEPLLAERHIDYGYALTDGPADATYMARDVTEAGYDAVIGIGGDGTLHEIAAGLPEAGILGVIPAGTGNDYAKNLGIPNDPVAALEALLTAVPSRVDRCTVNGRPFLNITGVGFDAKVAKEVQEMSLRAGGALPYLLAVFKQIVFHRNARATLYVDGQRIDGKVFWIAVGNGSYIGGGMKICPDARIDDGLLDVCIVGDVGRLETLVHLPKIFKGTHIRHPKVTYLRGRNVRIEGDALLCQADGELVGSTPVDISVLPQSLTVLAPRNSKPAGPQDRKGQPDAEEERRHVS